MKKEICKILDVVEASYYNFKRQNRPIIKLLEKYFNEDDLNEFLETGKITKLESAKEDLSKYIPLATKYLEFWSKEILYYDERVDIWFQMVDKKISLCVAAEYIQKLAKFFRLFVNLG